MPQLSDRVGTFTDSVIRRMTRINNQYDSINLSQGFPDFDPPKQLLDEAIRRLKNCPLCLPEHCNRKALWLLKTGSHRAFCVIQRPTAAGRG